MKAIVFGASGMVGKGVLLECLEDPAVEQILSIGRSPCGVSHPKLKERVHDNLADYAGIENHLSGYKACFFCLGVSSAGMKEDAYAAVTYGFTLAAAETLVKLNPSMTFCYVSGEGTDSTEKGRTMWARVKGRTENALSRVGFKSVYLFRPGYIQPMKGVVSKTPLYRAMYMAIGPLYPLLNGLFPKQITTTQKLGRAMIRVAEKGYPKTILRNQDINQIASGA